MQQNNGQTDNNMENEPEQEIMIYNNNRTIPNDDD